MAILSHMISDKMILNSTLVFILNVSPKFEIVVPNFRPSYQSYLKDLPLHLIFL